MRPLKLTTIAVCAGLAAACGSSSPDLSRVDIAKVADLKSSFGAPFTVRTVGPAAVDPRLLAGQKLPPGLTFDPAACATAAGQETLPAGVKGNMAATTAEGDGVRYIVIAVETSEQVPVATPTDQCGKVAFTGPGIRGLVERVDAPQIDGVHTAGTHRVLQTTTPQGPRTGELYNYVATFGNVIVVVTANPLVVADAPVAHIDTGKAESLVTQAVDAITR
jgi:hypothetical protein